MGINAVVFDLDGTLLDTLPDIADAMNRALTTLGYQSVSTEQYRYRVGWGARVLVEKTLPAEEQSESLIQRCIDEFQREYRAQPATRTVAYDGVLRLLQELSQRGVELSIVSNKPDELTQLVVKELLSDYRFAFVKGDHPDYVKKPDPQTTLLAIEAMGASAARTAFVGDSDVDMATAQAAGALAVGVAWGFRSPTELQQAGAQLVIEQPLELLRLLDPA